MCDTGMRRLHLWRLHAQPRRYVDPTIAGARTQRFCARALNPETLTRPKTFALGFGVLACVWSGGQPTTRQRRAAHHAPLNGFLALREAPYSLRDYSLRHPKAFWVS